MVVVTTLEPRYYKTALKASPADYQNSTTKLIVVAEFISTKQCTLSVL